LSVPSALMLSITITRGGLRHWGRPGRRPFVQGQLGGSSDVATMLVLRPQTDASRPAVPSVQRWIRDNVSYIPLDLELGTCRNRRPHHGLTTGISPGISGRRHA